MLEERDPKLDLLAVGLLALTIFLGVSLLTHDPADPPSNLVYPERTEISNVCGRYGALVSTFQETMTGEDDDWYVCEIDWPSGTVTPL